MSLEKKLNIALSMTTEAHQNAFERFANAFLVRDYPELEAIGVKKDKGMDARIVRSDTGELALVVQSCVSPAARARAKIEGTIKVLENIPNVLVYCTSARIGLVLDDLKADLRHRGITLLVHDSEWFCQRVHTSPDREKLSQTYAEEILRPLIAEVDPSRLYSSLLSESEERLVIKYLEANAQDRSKNKNMTKSIFESLVIYVLRETDSSMENTMLFDEVQIVSKILKMFPESYAQRIREIVPGCISRMVEKDAIKTHQNPPKYALSHAYKTKLTDALQKNSEREIGFRARFRDLLQQLADEKEIDYEYDLEVLARLGHECVIWFLYEQATQFRDAAGDFLNVLNAEELVEAFSKKNAEILRELKVSKEVIMDFLPSAIFKIASSADTEVISYLREKANIFIVDAFLQRTPDVQKACAKLLGNDLLYLDTTILIRCVAERYSEHAEPTLLKTLKLARDLGIQLRTWHQYVEEFVAHLKGPVLLEWINHPTDGVNVGAAYYYTTPTLIRVFNEYGREVGQSMNDIVVDIIGSSNEVENAIEFLFHEFNIATEQAPPGHTGDESVEWEKIFGIWLAEKKRWPGMKEDRFELLVRNDVTAYCAILRKRRDLKSGGPNYGHKVWLLTLDRMSWRIPKLLKKESESVYSISMGVHYLINYVATLSQLNSPRTVSEEPLPPILLMAQTDLIPTSIRSSVAKLFDDKTQKRYAVERKIRELVHNLKSSAAIEDEAFVVDQLLQAIPEKEKGTGSNLP